MKIGLHISDFTWDGGVPALPQRLGEIARRAEDAGVDRVSVMDHVWQIGHIGPPEHEMLEAYTTLGWLAARTERVKLLTVVTAVVYRDPGLLAKSVTTLDVLSGGRAMLGIGAGDYEDEAVGLGLPFGSFADRYDQLEDAIQVCLRMWTGDTGDERPFEGHEAHLGRPLNVPQSLQRPHPPILIAGSGEKRTLPLVARYADACNLPPSPELPRKLDILRGLCAEAGTDYDRIEKTAPFGFDVGERGEKVDELLHQLEWLAGMGIETVIGWVVGVERIRPLEIMAREVIPVVARFEPRRTVGAAAG